MVNYLGLALQNIIPTAFTPSTLNSRYSKTLCSIVFAGSLLLSGCSGGPSTPQTNYSSDALSSTTSVGASSSTPSSITFSSGSNSATLSSTSSISSELSSDSSSLSAAPPFNGTVYMDPDIFTADDPNCYQALEYLGRGEREVYDSRNEPKTTLQNVYRYKILFDDALSTEIQATPAFGSEQSAQEQALIFGKALGRLPHQLRSGIKIITLMQGEGRANASLAKGTIRIYSKGVKPELQEELLAHEGAHVSLDPTFRSHSDWLHAQQVDTNFISTYARDNFGSEDIAESVLPYLAVRYKPSRISAANERSISFNNPHRMAFFDQVFTQLYPMVDISQQTKAKFTTPAAPHTASHTLESDDITFAWTEPQGASAYDLVLGTQGYGSNNLRASNILNTNQVTINTLPNDGAAVFARLWTQKDNQWRYDDYRFSGFSPNIDAASIRRPAPGSQLASSQVTLHWDAPNNATQFDIIIGTQGAGSDNIRSSSIFSEPQLTVSGLPEDNKPIYVRLWTNKNGWNYKDFEYTASQTQAKLLSPLTATPIINANVTFEWDSPLGASSYDVIVGTNGPGSNDLRASEILNNNILTLTNLPVDGQKIYVRLWTLKGQWRFTDYTFN